MAPRYAALKHCCWNSYTDAALSPRSLLRDYRFGVIRQTALAAEPKWAPPADAKWEETDFASELTKLEEEAEKRMDAKVAELMTKIDKTGAK
jgi:hypothetical protein